MASFWLRDSIYTEYIFLRPTRPGEEWIIQSFTNPGVGRYLGGEMKKDEASATVKNNRKMVGTFTRISTTMYIHSFAGYT